MRINKGSLSSVVLQILEKSVDIGVRLEDFISNPGLYAHHGRSQFELPKSSLSQALKRLRERGLTLEEKIDDQLVIKLTKSGKNLLKTSFNEEVWDGYWRVVVFDIPEQKRVIRNLFRRNLKKWGFKSLQRSVWISKQPVFEQLERYIQDLKIEKWVVVLETKRFSAF